MTWESILSPDITYPLKVKVEGFSDNGLVRFGPNSLRPKESDVRMVERLLSMLTREEKVRYHYMSPGGITSDQLSWTNIALPPHYVFWHQGLDSVIGHFWDEIGWNLRAKGCVISIPMDTETGPSAYPGLDLFAGLQGL
jgi:hypothetical protein